MEDENFKAFVERMKSHSLKNVSMETQNIYRNNLDRKVELIKKSISELQEAFKKIDEETKIVDELKKEQNLEER